MAATANLLLDSLSPRLLTEVQSRAHFVSLPLRTVLYAVEETPAYAYFLTTGIASVVITSEDGATVEVEVIGCEGLVGSPHLLGAAMVPMQCFMQLPGSALRIRMTELREMFFASEELRGRILEFVQVQALTLSQIAGCHRLHTAEQRLARWLLMVRDRISGDTLALTQEFLAEMLGSQRTTVSAVAAQLQKAGVIEYSRGQLHILDQTRLEQVACGCYPIARALMRGLYGRAAHRPEPLTRPNTRLLGAA